MQTIIPPFSAGFHNRVYREYIRQRYNKFRHQHLRRPQAVILQKIIHEWTHMNISERTKLFENYSQRNETIFDESHDQEEVQSKKEVLNKKKQRKKTTAFKKKRVKMQEVSESEVKDNQTQQNKQKAQAIEQEMVMPKRQQITIKIVNIQNKRKVQSIPQIVQNQQNNKQEQSNHISINNSFISINQSLIIHTKEEDKPEGYIHKDSKVEKNQCLKNPLQQQIQSPKCFSPIKSEKKTDEQQRWQRQIDQNSIKKLLNLSFSFQQPKSIQIKPTKPIKQNPYLQFYKQKFSQIKQCFPQLTAVEITKVIKDLWKQEKIEMKNRQKKQQKSKAAQIKGKSKSKLNKKINNNKVKEKDNQYQKQNNDINKQMHDFLIEKPEDFPEDIWFELKKDPQKFINVGRKVII